MDIQEVIEAFEFLESWEERFELIADLGRELTPLQESQRIESNLVPGCNTRTWLTGRIVEGQSNILELSADAETPLVRGLVALLLMPFQNKSPREVLNTDPRPFIDRLGLEQALSTQRRAGVEALLERVRRIAQGFADQG